MQINVSGQSINLGESLIKHVEDKLSHTISKYFDKAISAHVDFVKEYYFYSCDITVNTGTHLILNAKNHSDDIYTAFDLTLVKLEKQLRKYKEKIKSHHKKSIHDLSNKEKRIINGTKYTISSTQDNEEDNPIIIAEKAMNVEELTVAEAVMKMDLSDLPALMFINKGNNRINMVYYRRDGNIAWIDPKEQISNT